MSEANFRDFIVSLLKQSNISEEYSKLLTDSESLPVFRDAFTHISYDPDNNYEVLEFIGDGIVKAINSQYIPEKYGEVLKQFESKRGTGEGALSKTRRYFEQSKFQYPIALKLGFWDHVRADEITKTQKRNKTLEDVMESYIGALVTVVDKRIRKGLGYLFAQTFLEKQLDSLNIEITPEMLDDPITRLNELYKANELSNNVKPLKWGDAVYDQAKLYLPKVEGLLNPAKYRPGEAVYNVDDKSVYVSTGNSWIHQSKLINSQKPRAANIGQDSKEFPDLFQPMWWVGVYGYPPQKRIIGQGIAFTKKDAKLTSARNALSYLKSKGIEKA